MENFDRDLCQILPTLRPRAARLTRNRADTDDLMQATAVQALVSRHRYDEIGNMAGWLATVMWTVHMNRVRYVKARASEYMDGELPTVAVQPVAELAVVVAEVGAALTRLTAKHRTAIIQDAAGYSYDEMAADWGIAIGTVKSRLNRARAALGRQGDFV